MEGISPRRWHSITLPWTTRHYQWIQRDTRDFWWWGAACSGKNSRRSGGEVTGGFVWYRSARWDHTGCSRVKAQHISAALRWVATGGWSHAASTYRPTGSKRISISRGNWTWGISRHERSSADPQLSWVSTAGRIYTKRRAKKIDSCKEKRGKSEILETNYLKWYSSDVTRTSKTWTAVRTPSSKYRESYWGRSSNTAVVIHSTPGSCPKRYSTGWTIVTSSFHSFFGRAKRCCDGTKPCSRCRRRGDYRAALWLQ